MRCRYCDAEVVMFTCSRLVCDSLPRSRMLLHSVVAKSVCVMLSLKSRNCRMSFQTTCLITWFFGTISKSSQMRGLWNTKLYLSSVYLSMFSCSTRQSFVQMFVHIFLHFDHLHHPIIQAFSGCHHWHFTASLANAEQMLRLL